MDTIILPDAPDISGLSFRPFRGESDWSQMAAVFEASNQVDHFDWAITENSLRREFAHLLNCDPYQDMLVAEIGGRMIAYNRVWWEEEVKGDRTYHFTGLLVPEWRRKGIGRAMVRHAQRRLGQIARGHPADAPKYLQRSVVDSEVGLEILLRKEGYEPARYEYELVRPIALPVPEAPMPPGLEVRPVRDEDLSAIIQADDEVFRDYWAQRPLTPDELQRWMESPAFDPSLWKVAWDGDQAAGGVLGFIDREENAALGRRRGYTEEVWVRPAWRRRGLARSLLAQSIRMFAEMGMQETALGADPQNPNHALEFYESMGYQIVKRKTFYRKPMSSACS